MSDAAATGVAPARRDAVTKLVARPVSHALAHGAASITVLAVLGTLLFPGGAAASGQLLGAQSHATWGSVSFEEMDRELDLLDRAGATAVRTDISWSSLETEGKGDLSRWYVERFERFLQGAEARGIEVIATLWSTPCWASSAPEELKQGCAGLWWERGVERYGPVNAADYADAAAWVAARWGTRLGALELWNEPNVPEHGFLRAPDPGLAYARLVRAAYPRIKAAAPGLPVLAGALAYSDEAFLERMYSLGLEDHFDGVSLHPYNEWRDPRDPWRLQWRRYTFVTGVPHMHRVMSAHGDGDKQLWLTEFGWSTCGDGDRWCVSEQQQADFVRAGLRLVRGWPFVRAAIVYNLRNKGSDPTDREHQFGLVRRDFSPKPGYVAFQQALSEGAPAPAPAPSAPGSTHVQLVAAPMHPLAPRRALRVRIRCKGRGAAAARRRCVGRLRAAARLRGTARRRSRRVRAARGRRFAVRAGRARTIPMRLSPRARRLVARRGRARIVVVASTRHSGVARRRIAVIARR
jgi:polysaccharide biosynthesis protein PslG